jgi:hypothetical protein
MTSNKIPEEMVEELVSFVRRMADEGEPSTRAEEYDLHQRCKALAAKLPPPVDPDIEEARKLLCARRSGDAGDPPCWQAVPDSYAAADCSASCLRDATVIAAYFKSRTQSKEGRE